VFCAAGFTFREFNCLVDRTDLHYHPWPAAEGAVINLSEWATLSGLAFIFAAARKIPYVPNVNIHKPLFSGALQKRLAQVRVKDAREDRENIKPHYRPFL
jgi:hypothetical protein